MTGRLSTAPFTLELIGGFDLRSTDGARVRLPTRKAQLLLAFLALPAGMPHPRDRLATLLWGDRQEDQARGSLRNALAAIRAALGTDCLAAERDVVRLAPGWLACDVDVLASLATSGSEGSEELLGRALAADLLLGQASPPGEFAEWLEFERARCRRYAQVAAEKAIARLAARRAFERGIDLAERLLAQDQMREQSHRLLMQVLVAAGERSRALAQYQACFGILKRELGVAPTAETAALARRIAEDGALPADPPQAAPSGQSGGTSHPAPEGRFSIAVLPFANPEDEPGQRYLAEGFAEDLVTELSRRKDFLVIARQSSARYSGRADSAAVAAAELAVRYALTGSLRRAADRLRISVQLVDALGNRFIWAERYDREMTDIFTIQDEIVASIIGSVDAEMRADARDRAARKLPRDLDSWELFHKGLWHVYRFTPDDIRDAEQCFRAAIRHQPDFALPHAGLAYAGFVKAIWHFSADPEAAVRQAIADVNQALALDPGNAFVHVTFGRLLVLAGELKRALFHLGLAVEINPSFAQAHAGRAQALIYAGKPEEALQSVDLAIRLSPKDPLMNLFLTLRSFCHISLGEFAAAETAARIATQVQSRETWSRLALAVALVQLGRVDEARTAIREARAIEPALSRASFETLVRYSSPQVRSIVNASLEAAGFG